MKLIDAPFCLFFAPPKSESAFREASCGFTLASPILGVEVSSTVVRIDELVSESCLRVGNSTDEEITWEAQVASRLDFWEC